MSEHEGFGVPLVESMLMRRARAGLWRLRPFRDTLGGAGVQFAEKSLAETWPSWPTSRHRRDAAGAGPRRAGPAPRGLRPGGGGGRPPRLRRVAVSARRPELAIVVQRYGAEVTGGSESLARAVAERLAADFRVTVFTTCARDYVTWRNELPAGTEPANGVEVARFPVEEERDLASFNRLSPSPLRRRRALGGEPSFSGCGARGPTRPAWWRPSPGARTTSRPSCSSPISTPRPTGGSKPPPSGRSSSRRPTTSRPCASPSTGRSSRSAGLRFLLRSRGGARASAVRPRRSAHGGHGHRHRGPAGSRHRGLPDPPRRPRALRCSTPAASTRGRAAPRCSPTTTSTGRNCRGARRAPSHREARHARRPGCPASATSATSPRTRRWRPWRAPGPIVCPSPYESLSIVLLEGLALGTPGLVNAPLARPRGPLPVRSRGALYYASADEFVEALDLLVARGRLARGPRRERSSGTSGTTIAGMS